MSVVTDEIAGRNLSAWAAEDHACGSCSLAYAQITVDDAVQAIRALPAQLRAAVDPMFNDLRADLFRYNQANLTAVLDETAAATAGLCTEISRMNGPDWERVVLRQPGEQRTSRWLVRQAMHEGLHHLDDIAAVRASLSHSQRDLPGPERLDVVGPLARCE